MKITFAIAVFILKWLADHRYITKKEALRIMETWKRDGIIK